MVEVSMCQKLLSWVQKSDWLMLYVAFCTSWFGQHCDRSKSKIAVTYIPMLQYYLSFGHLNSLKHCYTCILVYFFEDHGLFQTNPSCNYKNYHRVLFSVSLVSLLKNQQCNKMFWNLMQAHFFVAVFRSFCQKQAHVYERIFIFKGVDLK